MVSAGRLEVAPGTMLGRRCPASLLGRFRGGGRLGLSRAQAVGVRRAAGSAGVRFGSGLAIVTRVDRVVVGSEVRSAHRS